MVEFMSYLGVNNMGLISWCRDVWYRYFYGCEEEPKTYVDINGKEHDMEEYNRDWVIREKRVERELRRPRVKPVTFGDELREITKENQNRISNKAATEAQIIFDVISKDFVKQSQDGYSSIYYNDEEFEDIMANNHIADSIHVWKELKKICERNKIHAYVDDGLYPIVCYYRFEWK